MAKVDKLTLARAKALRANLTDAEKTLWQLLRRGALAGYRFRRQPPYVLDFACVSAMLAIEVDGGQHHDSRRDAVRDAFLVNKGWRVLRFWNNDVLRLPMEVAMAISSALGPLPNPPPAEPGEGGEPEPQP